MEDATRRRELAHGLRALDECDTPISATEWTLKMTNDADWAFGGKQQLLPTDTVVRFSPRRGAMGLAILRGDRIAAQYVELYID